MSTPHWGLHWFRRDLRVCGNPALDDQIQAFAGRVLGVFCFDRDFLSRPDFSPDRFAFFLDTLKSLQEDLRSAGGDLLVLDHPPRETFPIIFEALRKRGLHLPQRISWNRDYEPFARNRDRDIETMLGTWGVDVSVSRDHLFVEPLEISPPDSKKNYYSVYSPYARRWFEFLNSPGGAKRLHICTERLRRMALGHKNLFRLSWSELFGNTSVPLEDALDRTRAGLSSKVRVEIPRAGRKEALKALNSFQTRIDQYKDNRDFPSLEATSGLSLYFKNGSITSTEVLSIASLGQEFWKSSTGPTHFVKEIAWREFYYHILWHRPDVEQQSFLEHTREIHWENNSYFYEKWKTGQTGFPIVDAGMRELASTGRMHNRLRMIVASFLVKDLLIDWRWGERYFMERLLDGDLAANNGGWQWAASTGCDPQPYFRIFNPSLQSLKFDPNGSYISKWVPELRHLQGTRSIHAPSQIERGCYPEPIVDHGAQRLKALQMFKRLPN